MSTYRKLSKRVDIFEDEGEREWAIKKFKEIELAALLEIVEKLGPIVMESGDKSLETAFDVFVTKTIVARIVLEQDNENQRNKNISNVCGHWDRQKNAVKFADEIKIARNLMALPTNTRDDILDKVIRRFGKGPKKLVKGKDKKELARILRDNKALPPAR